MSDTGDSTARMERMWRVEAFLTEYAHAIDDDDLAGWPDFFSEDAIYRVISRESYDAGHTVAILSCHGRGMMSDRIRALRQANIFEAHRYCHLLGRSTVTEENNRLQVRTNFTVVRTMYDGASDLFVSGAYLDEMNDDEGKLTLRRRDVVLDSRRVDTLLVIPL